MPERSSKIEVIWEILLMDESWKMKPVWLWPHAGVATSDTLTWQTNVKKLKKNLEKIPERQSSTEMGHSYEHVN